MEECELKACFIGLMPPRNNLHDEIHTTHITNIYTDAGAAKCAQPKAT